MEPSTNRRGWIIAIAVVLAVICLCLILAAVAAAILFFVPVQRSLSQPASIGGLALLSGVLRSTQDFSSARSADFPV